jgi:GntR family transcriptional regulator, transcriptional repressor for pyruvate dehydrogenase complex
MRAHLLSAARRSGIDLNAPQPAPHLAPERMQHEPVSFRLVSMSESEGVFE